MSSDTNVNADIEYLSDVLRRAYNAGVEQAAQLAEIQGHVGGIIVARELADEVLTDGDPVAPMIKKGSAVERIANGLLGIERQAIAARIRSLITEGT